MKIHEYQGRQLLADAGIPVPGGRMVERAEDGADEEDERHGRPGDRGRLAYCTSAVPGLAGLRGGTYDPPTAILELYQRVA
ncbi:MAG: hypothetical protein ACKOJI_05685, partial [Phycisphaerales bacterium]